MSYDDRYATLDLVQDYDGAAPLAWRRRLVVLALLKLKRIGPVRRDRDGR
jgi:hypothetical protein